MVLQIHDELIFDIVASEEEVIKNIVKKEMEQVIKLSVPLRVEISVARNWYDV